MKLEEKLNSTPQPYWRPELQLQNLKFDGAVEFTFEYQNQFT